MSDLAAFREEGERIVLVEQGRLGQVVRLILHDRPGGKVLPHTGYIHRFDEDGDAIVAIHGGISIVRRGTQVLVSDE